RAAMGVFLAAETGGRPGGRRYAYCPPLGDVMHLQGGAPANGEALRRSWTRPAPTGTHPAAVAPAAVAVAVALDLPRQLRGQADIAARGQLAQALLRVLRQVQRFHERPHRSGGDALAAGQRLQLFVG